MWTTKLSLHLPLSLYNKSLKWLYRVILTKMEHYRSLSCRDDVLTDNNEEFPTNMKDLRSYSTWNNDIKKASSKDRELLRKKRVAAYNAFREGKMRGSFKKSFGWIKNTYTQLLYGYWFIHLYGRLDLMIMYSCLFMMWSCMILYGYFAFIMIYVVLWWKRYVIIILARMYAVIIELSSCRSPSLIICLFFFYGWLVCSIRIYFNLNILEQENI